MRLFYTRNIMVNMEARMHIMNFTIKPMCEVTAPAIFWELLHTKEQCNAQNDTATKFSMVTKLVKRKFLHGRPRPRPGPASKTYCDTNADALSVC